MLGEGCRLAVWRQEIDLALSSKLQKWYMVHGLIMVSEGNEHFSHAILTNFFSV